MKVTLLSISIMALCLALSAAKWETFTNTSHVYDLMVQEDQIYFSSWGGVLQVADAGTGNFSQMEEKAIWTTADGLASNDVRNIEYIGFSQSLWFGSTYDGVSIISPQGVQQMNTSLGLPSNNVSKIIEHGSEILVATANGLGSFYYLEGVNFPLMLHQYTTQTTNGGLLSNQIDAMVLAGNNYLYLGTNAGVNFVHLDSLAINSAWHHFNTALVPAGYTYKLSTNAQKLLITASTGGMLHSIDPWNDNWDYINDLDGLLHKQIASACIDELNTIWVSYGTWSEDFLNYSRDIDTLMTSIDTSGNVKHWAEFEAGLGDKTISKVVSAAGRIYLCSWGDGIFRLEGDHWSQFVPNSIGFPNIRSITTDQNNAIWFGSGNISHLQLRKSALGASKYLNGTWQSFNIANSPIHTDNILSIAVDSHNRKWFGTYDVSTGSPAGWRTGISVWDEDTGIWKLFSRYGVQVWNEEEQAWGAYLPGSPTLLGGTTVYSAQDQNGNMLITCYDRGFTVLDSADNLIGTFTTPNGVYQRSTYSFHNGRQYFIGTESDRGLVIWNHNSLPVSGGNYWLIPPPGDLNNCEVYGVISVQSPYEGWQHWIAASTGLFMWNEQNWYKYDTSIKRFKYNTSNGLWDNDLLYYADEERLYGSVRTTPTAIYLDPFDRIWIGSLDHGLSMYDPATERFRNYFQDNSPLLSDQITALGYNPLEGKLLVGTPDGLNTLKIGVSLKPETKLQDLKIYPNPFRPDQEISPLQISNFPTDILPRGTNQCRIFDSSGVLVIKLSETKLNRFEWDGNNALGKQCSSGIYFVVISDDQGNKLSGKIALIRD